MDNDKALLRTAAGEYGDLVDLVWDLEAACSERLPFGTAGAAVQEHLMAVRNGIIAIAAIKRAGE